MDIFYSCPKQRCKRAIDNFGIKDHFGVYKTRLCCKNLIDQKFDKPNLEITTAMKSRNAFSPLRLTPHPFPPSYNFGLFPEKILTGTYSPLSRLLLRRACSRFLFALSPRSFAAGRAASTNGKRID